MSLSNPSNISKSEETLSVTTASKRRTFGFWWMHPWRAFRLARKGATPVTTRLTREGWQFCFMIAFIVLGAVLRDVNLLIILAGTLVSLLLIQWRVCAKSLYGLVLYRRLPRAMQARKQFEIELTITNPKSWLGAWLVFAQDRLVHAQRSNATKPTSQNIGILFPALPPGTTRVQRYQCTVQKRGLYEFLGTEISTRFPLGLMRSVLNASTTGTFVVQPALGRLLPGWLELFDGKTTGIQQRKSRALSDEGEFFGLRAYHPGDSPRWIHWRSSARTNELMIKQYQRSDSREFVLLLDLCMPASKSKSELENYFVWEELAIEFAATLANHVAISNSAVMTLAIADSHPTIAVRVQTRSQNTALLDRLGTATSSAQDALPAALEMLEREYRRIDNLLVLSTRSKNSVMSTGIRSTHNDRTLQFWKNLVWLNASAGELKPYFVPAS